MDYQGGLGDATGHQDGRVGVRRSRANASRHFGHNPMLSTRDETGARDATRALGAKV